MSTIAVLLLVVRILMAVALYAFIGWALFLLWRDLKSQAELLASQKLPVLNLTQPGETGPIQLSFSKSEVIIGRDPTCDCQVDDRTVSTQHARLSFHHRQWWLEDLNSTNGTTLNQEPVSSPVVLTTGDRIGCGRVGLTVEIESH